MESIHRQRISACILAAIALSACDGAPSESRPQAKTRPPEAKSAEAKPGTESPATEATETKPVDAKPVDAKPGDAKPGDTKPGDTKPVDPESPPPPTEAKHAYAVTDPAKASPRAIADALVPWVGMHPPSDGMPTPLLPPAGSITVLLRTSACDGASDECTESTTKTGKALQGWLAEYEDMPGWDVAQVSKCDDTCCTFGNAARKAAREGGMMPATTLELRAVCVHGPDAAAPGTLRRVKFIEH